MNVRAEGQPMYLLPEFFEVIDVENLFGEGIESTGLNNHACARALDKLAEAGENTVLGTVFLRAAVHENISRNVLHADTTSFSIQGLYEAADEDNYADTLSITHGYSTDNNRQLISNSSKPASVSTEPAFPSSDSPQRERLGRNLEHQADR